MNNIWYGFWFNHLALWYDLCTERLAHFTHTNPISLYYAVVTCWQSDPPGYININQTLSNSKKMHPYPLPKLMLRRNMTQSMKAVMKKKNYNKAQKGASKHVTYMSSTESHVRRLGQLLSAGALAWRTPRTTARKHISTFWGSTRHFLNGKVWDALVQEG